MTLRTACVAVSVEVALRASCNSTESPGCVGTLPGSEAKYLVEQLVLGAVGLWDVGKFEF